MTMGHNSLTHIADRAVAGLQKVAQGRDTEEQGWLEYGTALNEGRTLHPDDDKAFGKWKKNLLKQVAQVKPIAEEERAAMWAAANPDQLAQAKALDGKTSTLRGLHKAWKDAYEEKPEPQPEPDEGTPEAKPNTSKRPSEDRIMAAERVLDGEATMEEAASEIGVSVQVMKTTKSFVEGYRAAATDNAIVEGLSASQAKKLEAAKRREIRDLRRTFGQEVHVQVRKEVDEWKARYIGDAVEKAKDLERRLDRAIKRQERDGEGIDPAEYKAMLKVFHGATAGAQVSEAVARKAYDAFQKLNVRPFTKDELEAQRRSREFLEKLKAAEANA